MTRVTLEVRWTYITCRVIRQFWPPGGRHFAQLVLENECLIYWYSCGRLQERYLHNNGGCFKLPMHVGNSGTPRFIPRSADPCSKECLGTSNLSKSTVLYKPLLVPILVFFSYTSHPAAIVSNDPVIAFYVRPIKNSHSLTACTHRNIPFSSGMKEGVVNDDAEVRDDFQHIGGSKEVSR